MDRLPSGLATLIQNYVQYARPLLVSQSEEQAPTFLVTPSGNSFDYQSLRQMWLDVQAEYRVEWTPFAPRHLRHVFADRIFKDALDAAAALPHGGASVLLGSTQIMGNSPVTLRGHYAQRVDQHAMEAAIARVAAWRSEQVPKVRALMASYSSRNAAGDDPHGAGPSRPRTPRNQGPQKTLPATGLRGTGGAVSISVARLMNLTPSGKKRAPDTAGTIDDGTTIASKRLAKDGAQPVAVAANTATSGLCEGGSPKRTTSTTTTHVNDTSVTITGTTTTSTTPSKGEQSSEESMSTCNDGSTPAAVQNTESNTTAARVTAGNSSDHYLTTQQPHGMASKDFGWFSWASQLFKKKQ